VLQGNRVKRSIRDETCQVVVITSGDLAADAQGIFLAGRFSSDVDFGFKVGLAEFEKSTRYGKSVPLRFRFQLRLDRRFFGFNWDWSTA